jgi:hypothetical protein
MRVGVQPSGRVAAGRLFYEGRERRLCDEWEMLCARYLPVAPPSSIWRYSRESLSGDPKQGWKLHVAATVLSACRVMKRVGPCLRRRGVLFKAPVSLHELRKINCGAIYGFSQVGKFITVYPKDEAEAVWLARELDGRTRGLPGPKVPYDLPYRPGGCVSYRYGSYSSEEVTFPDGSRSAALRNPSGELVPDRRTPGSGAPSWAIDPFRGPQSPCEEPEDAGPLGKTILAYEALSQRGKGGVYRAFDVGARPPRACVLKEGRRHGETCWDGRDGYRRARHEARVISELSAAGVPAPALYGTFEARRNFYLVLEAVEGRTLQEVLDEHRGPMPLAQAFHYGARVAALLSQVHSAGWVWRDCKPSNIIVTPGGSLRPLDFEGACRVTEDDAVPWVTSGYVPATADEASGRPKLSEDLYSLGIILRQLFGGPGAEVGRDVALPGSARDGLPDDAPPSVRRLIRSLLEHNSKAPADSGAVSAALARSCAGFDDARTAPAPLVL